MDVPNRAEHPSRKQGDHTSPHDGSYKLQMQHPGGNTTPKLPLPVNLPFSSREPASPSPSNAGGQKLRWPIQRRILWAKPRLP
jgi:hypothetical protein